MLFDFDVPVYGNSRQHSDGVADEQPRSTKLLSALPKPSIEQQQTAPNEHHRIENSEVFEFWHRPNNVCPRHDKGFHASVDSDYSQQNHITLKSKDSVSVDPFCSVQNEKHILSIANPKANAQQ
jgi:hypothetical protein